LTDEELKGRFDGISREITGLAERMERHETTILRAIRELGQSHKSRLDEAEAKAHHLSQRLSNLEQRVLELETK
jgi:predicted mannosyl-3-phosphoglycerate phosphatase (HAD superfamily)